ncbi:MAG TPA: site-specific integrase, partial [Mycobacterium sp.]
MTRRQYGSIRRLPSGRYQARYTDRAGAKITAPQTWASRIDAEGWLARRQHDADAGIERPAPRRQTFAEYAAVWLAGRHVAG